MSDTPQPDDKSNVPNDIWRDPYSRGNVLLPPDVVEQLKNLRDNLDDATQKEAGLRAQGYIPFLDAAKRIGISDKTLRSRTNQGLNLEDDYRTDGTKPKGEPGENIVKGNDLWWSHPAKNLALLHPDYVEGQESAELTRKQLKEAGYIEGNKAAEQIGFTIGGLINRAKNIIPDKSYTPGGLPIAEGYEGEAVKGSDLYWRHPYREKLWLFRPSYIQGQIDAAKKEKELKAEGYLVPEDAAREIGTSLSGFLRRAYSLESNQLYDALGTPTTLDSPVDNPKYYGHQLRWKNPYSDKSTLYSPIYVQAHKAVEQKIAKLKAEGYMTVEEVAKKAGVGRSKISQRIRLIPPNDLYGKNGKRPTSEDRAEDLIRGSELAYDHPLNPFVILLRPEYAAGTIEAYKMRKTLLDAGYKFLDQWATETGIKKTTLWSRVYHLDENQQANQDPPIKWKDPYRTEGWLISPQYIQAQVEADMEYKELVDKGYMSYPQVADGYLTESLAKAKAGKIETHKMYRMDGSPATGEADEATFSGAELKWQHPFDNTILLHPELIANWRKSAKAWGAGEKEMAPKEPLPPTETDLKIATGYKTISAAAQEIGMNEGTLRSRTIKIDPNLMYNEYGQVIKNHEAEGIKGSELVWRSTDDKRGIFYVHPCFITAYKKTKEKQEELVGKGYTSIEDSAALIGIDSGTLGVRTKILKPDTYYHTNGIPAEDHTKPAILLGSELKWMNPINGTVLLHPDYVQAQKTAHEQQATLISTGYMDTAKAAEEIGIGVNNLRETLQRIKDDVDYPIPSEDDQLTHMKGNTIKWTNPYSKGNLVNPTYVRGFAAAEKKHKKLVQEGYAYFGDVAQRLKIDKRQLSYLTAKIAPEGFYSNDGQPVTPDTEGVLKGKHLRWAHPFDTHVVLFHPQFVEKLQKRIHNQKHAAEKEKDLIKQGYFTLESAAEYTEIQYPNLVARSRQYNPKEGFLITGGTSDQGGVGKDLIYRPASGKGILVHPSLVHAWKHAEDQEKQFIAAGYLSREQIEEQTGFERTSIKSRTKKIEESSDNIANPSSPLIWRKPYSGDKKIYYHPTLADRWKKEKDATRIVSKGGTTETIGATFEESVPKEVADMLNQLEKQREDNRDSHL